MKNTKQSHAHRQDDPFSGAWKSKYSMNIIYVFIFMLLGGTFLPQVVTATDEPKKVSPTEGSSVQPIQFSATPSLAYGGELTEDSITVLEFDAFEISFPKLYQTEFAYAGLSWGYFENSVFEGNGEAVDVYLNLQLISDLGNEKLKVEITDTVGDTVSYYADGLKDDWQTYQFDVSDLNGNLAFVYFVYAAPYDQYVNSAQVKVKAGYIGLTVDVLPGDNTLQLTDFSVVPVLGYGGALTSDLIAVPGPDTFELSLPALDGSDGSKYIYAGLSWGYFDPVDPLDPLVPLVFNGDPEEVEEGQLLTLQLKSADLGNQELKVEITDTAGGMVAYYVVALTVDWQTYSFDISALNGELASVLCVYDTVGPVEKSISVQAGSIGLAVDVSPNDDGSLVPTEFEIAPVLGYGGALTSGLIAVPGPDTFELSLPALDGSDGSKYIYAGLSWGYFDPDTRDFIGTSETIGQLLTLQLKSADLGNQELKVEITDTAGGMVAYYVVALTVDWQTYSFDISALNGELASVLCVYDTVGPVEKSISVQAGSIGLAVDVSPIDDGTTTTTEFEIAPVLGYGGALTSDLIAVPGPDTFELSLPALDGSDGSKYIYAGLSWGYFDPVDPLDPLAPLVFNGYPEVVEEGQLLRLQLKSADLVNKELKVEITDTAGEMVAYSVFELTVDWQTYSFDISALNGKLASVLCVYDTVGSVEKSISVQAGSIGLAVDVSPIDDGTTTTTEFEIAPVLGYGGALTSGLIAVPGPDTFELSLPALDGSDESKYIYAGLSWGYFNPDTEDFIGNPETIGQLLRLQLKSADLVNKELKVEITDTAGEMVAYSVVALTVDWQTYSFDISALNGELASVLCVYDTVGSVEKSISVQAGSIGLAVDVSPAMNNSTLTEFKSNQPSLGFGGVLNVDSRNNDGTFKSLGIAELTRGLVTIPHQHMFKVDLLELKKAQFLFAGISWGYFNPETNQFIGKAATIGIDKEFSLELKSADSVDRELLVDRELKIEITDTAGTTVSYYIRGLSTDWQTYQFDLSMLDSQIASMLFVYDTLGKSKELSVRGGFIGLPVDVEATTYDESQLSTVPKSTALVKGSGAVSEDEVFTGTFELKPMGIKRFEVEYADIDDGEFGWVSLSRGFFDDLTEEFKGLPWKLDGPSLTVAADGRDGDRLKMEIYDVNGNTYMVNLFLTGTMQNYTIDLSSSELDLRLNSDQDSSSSEPSGGLAYINFVFDMFYTGDAGVVAVEMINIPYSHTVNDEVYEYSQHTIFTEMPITFAPFGNTTDGTIDLVQTYSNKFYYDYSIDPDGFVFCQIKWGDFMSNGEYSGDTQDFSLNPFITFGVNGPEGHIKVEVSDDQATKALFDVTLTGSPQNITLDLSQFAEKIDLAKIISITFVGESGAVPSEGVVGVKTGGLDYLPRYSSAYEHKIGLQGDINFTDYEWQTISYDQVIVDPVVFFSPSLGLEYEVLSNQSIRIRATGNDLPLWVTYTVLESGSYETRLHGVVEVSRDSDGNVVDDRILQSLETDANGDVFLPPSLIEWTQENVESFSDNLTEAETEMGLLIELNIAAGQTFPVVYVQSKVLLNGQWVNAGRSICSQTDRGFIYINPAYLKEGGNAIALHVEDRLGQPLGVDIEYEWSAQSLNTVWSVGLNDASDSDFQQSNYNSEAVVFSSVGQQVNEFPKEISLSSPIQLIDFYLTNEQVQRPKELNLDVATSNGSGTLTTRLDYYNHDKDEWMPVDQFELGVYAPAVVELALHELYEGHNQLRLKVVGPSDASTNEVTWDKVGLYERLKKPQVALDFLLKVMSTSLNYFLDDSAAMHHTALPMTAVKTGKVLNRERFGWSNPTEWGLGMQSWIAAYEMSGLAADVQSKLTEAQILDMIERSLTEMERIQLTPEDYKVNLFYPAYRMTVGEQGETQGDDQVIVKDGVNDKLPIGDVALHWASVNVVHGWMIDLQSNKANSSEAFSELQELIDLAIRVKDRMKFEAGYFVDADDGGHYLAHVLDGAELIDDPDNPGSQIPNPRFGLPAIPDNATDAKPTVWNVWSDEGGVVNIICSITNSITEQQFADVLDSQFKNERTWQGITVKDTAFFNAAFTWAQRTMLGFPIFGDIAERQYGVYSFLPAARSHLAYADYIAAEKTAKIDYPAFSDAMTQSDDRQPTSFKGLIGRWTPVVDEVDFFNAQNSDPDFAMPSHTQPHALFVWLGAFPYMEQGLFYRYFEASMELMYDAKGYWHGENDPHPYGFEVIASPFIDDLTYQGANDGRDIFEALSVGYTVLPLYDGLARVSTGRTFDYFRSKVDQNVNNTLEQVTVLAYDGRRSGTATAEPEEWPQPLIDAGADADGDGLPDELETYFAKNPTVSDGPWYDVMSMDEMNGEPCLTVTFKRAVGHAANDVVFEVTDNIADPTSWSSEGFVETTMISVGDPETIQIQVLIDGRTRLFLRVRMVE